uniref:Si:dkey-31g6.6 n=1 Tax=Petromyzon marinus TaxID=7757 RepID=S4RBJ8_PETMA
FAKLLLITFSSKLVLNFVAESTPILTQEQANQILRSKRSPPDHGYPNPKAGHADEPMREYLMHLQVLEARVEERNLEHWLNPHCLPHCNRNYVHPV